MSSGHSQHDPRVPSEGWIGYTAGLIDGEGCLYVDGKRPRLSISQGGINNERAGNLVRFVAELWGCGRWQRSDTAFGECWHWYVDRRLEIGFVLRACLPYLRVKRGRADEFLVLVGDAARGRWTRAEDQLLRDRWTEPDAALATVLGRTPDSVRYRRTKVLDLPRKPPGGTPLPDR